MVSRTVRAASGFAAAFCFALLGFAGQAQTSSSTPSSSAAQQAPSSQANTPSSAPAQSTVAPLQLHDLPSPPHTPTPEEAAQQEQQRVLMEVARLANMQAQWGPPSSTPGLSIDLKEVGRMKTPNGSTQIAWQITGKGFPPGQKLVLLKWPLDARPQALMSGVQFDSQGTAICGAPPVAATGAGDDTTQGLAAASASLSQSGAAPSAPPPSKETPPQVQSCAATIKPGQPIRLQSAVASGEAVRVALVGNSEKNGQAVRIGAATSLVPYPMENTDKGCTLQVIRGMKNAGMVLVQGDGFPANTSLKVETVTSEQTRTMTARSNAKGSFVIAVLPGLEGRDEGDTDVHMGGAVQAPSLEAPKTPPAAAAPGCDPSVIFHWGKGSYQPH
jgi:hypothetical protein